MAYGPRRVSDVSGTEADSIPLSEQIRVRSRPDEVQVVAVDFVDQQLIRLEVAITDVLPVAAATDFLDQQQDHLTQLRHVLAALLGEFHIAPELRASYRVPHRLRFSGP